ncbi:hypothetical protein LP419_12475 [Massilia sp. H-1]|nr:hypothetical protein LP419_12475 [Massilia sp. H-1]
MSLGGGRSNKTEQRAFDALQTKGVLSIAAAKQRRQYRDLLPCLATAA